jgi:hypothetical protein
MEKNSLKTVANIAKFVKQKVQAFRKFPSKKAQVISELMVVFAIDSEPWAVVIDEGKFRESFVRIMGKSGMRSLKKLLLELDSNHYSEIDFGIE